MLSRLCCFFLGHTTLRPAIHLRCDSCLVPSVNEKGVSLTLISRRVLFFPFLVASSTYSTSSRILAFVRQQQHCRLFFSSFVRFTHTCCPSSSNVRDHYVWWGGASFLPRRHPLRSLLQDMRSMSFNTERHPPACKRFSSKWAGFQERNDCSWG